MFYLFIGIREQGVRDLIDQLLDDQNKMYRYVDISENYDMSQLNAQGIKIIN